MVLFFVILALVFVVLLVIITNTVSYTHLTLPTKLEV